MSQANKWETLKFIDMKIQAHEDIAIRALKIEVLSFYSKILLNSYEFLIK